MLKNGISVDENTDDEEVGIRRVRPCSGVSFVAVSWQGRGCLSRMLASRGCWPPFVAVNNIRCRLSVRAEFANHR